PSRLLVEHRNGILLERRGRNRNSPRAEQPSACTKGRSTTERMVGPVGLEPTTKGFTCSAVSGGSGLSLHPRALCPGGCGTLEPVIKSAFESGRWPKLSSSQVVSAPSGGAPPAWLRVAGANATVSLNSSRPLRGFHREGTSR